MILAIIAPLSVLAVAACVLLGAFGLTRTTALPPPHLLAKAKVGARGQTCVPKAVMAALNVQGGDTIQYYATSGGIFLAVSKGGAA